jgi:hypothetical protein
MCIIRSRTVRFTIRSTLTPWYGALYSFFEPAKHSWLAQLVMYFLFNILLLLFFKELCNYIDFSPSFVYMFYAAAIAFLENAGKIK